ncbi:DUF3783 domain-containing protein [Thermococcus waiotapuensis]|uniref:DUF3783 domain-containing protein n=1 Tax=Thermococcus waiotapuensis TaxID=90909 RepID=A0AAE4NT41_9EURY|nr:DUF3783 domain-containing protein [Thermococcus waiotapuensis]MDV3103135.1 DUF3783 domain-containing protein [Thermococcus waiotapuensis]
MIFLIGFSEEEVRLVRDAFGNVPVYEIPAECRGWVLSEIIEKAGSLKGSGNWHGRKFFLMHDLGNEEIKDILRKMKSLGFREVIYATTTPNSLTMRLDDLIEEWLEEDEYFRRLRNMKKGPYLNVGSV